MRKRNFLKFILLAGDIFIAYAAFFLALAARNENLLFHLNDFFYRSLVLYVFWFAVIFFLNLYDLNFFKKPIDFFFSIVVFSVLAFLVGVTYFYFKPEPDLAPKTILVLNILFFNILFVCWRYVFNLFLEAGGVKDRIVIIGSSPELKEVMPQINKRYEVLALFCPPYIGEQKKCLFFYPGIETISEIADLKSVVTEKRVNSVIFALDFYSNKDLVKEIFSALPLTIKYIEIDDLYEYINKKISLDYLDEIWFLEKVSKPEDIFSKIVKRTLDIALSMVGLIIFIIFLPFIAIAIKLDSSGSVFYSQERVGRKGKVFVMHKFRTMTENKDQDKDTWREINKNNVTGVGKVLRKLHLDELPQAWNIFKGDLSFVGPRAEWSELTKIFEKEIPFYKQRYLVKPGLIGWAQINFPASKSVDQAKEKFEYDLYYIKNQSILLDIEIILKAVKLFLW